MTTWLTASWFEAARSQCDRPTRFESVDVRVQWELTGGSAGTVKVFSVVEGGRFASFGLGALEDAEVTISLAETDARAINAGELDPSVAYMQGRMKATGSMRGILDLLTLLASSEVRASQRWIAAITEY